VLQPRFLPRSPQLSFLTMSVLADGEAPQQAQQAQQAAAMAEAGPGDGRQPQPAGSEAREGAAAAPPVPQELVFLYRLVAGHAAPSFGLYCARLAGVPSATLERARGFLAAQVSRCQSCLDTQNPCACNDGACRNAPASSPLLGTRWPHSLRGRCALQWLTPLPPTSRRLPQAHGAALHRDPAGQHAQRATTYRGLVARLAALNVHDGEAAARLAADAAEALA
jgi:hypothetical protein